MANTQADHEARFARLQQENELLHHILRLARDGLLIAVAHDDDYDWPDGHPDLEADGRTITYPLGQSGDYATAPTALGADTIRRAIALTSTVVNGRDEYDATLAAGNGLPPRRDEAAAYEAGYREGYGDHTQGRGFAAQTDYQRWVAEGRPTATGEKG
jgi:hypothetical protein